MSAEEAIAMALELQKLDEYDMAKKLLRLERDAQVRGMDDLIALMSAKRVAS
jgi:hypothetical protein